MVTTQSPSSRTALQLGVMALALLISACTVDRTHIKSKHVEWVPPAQGVIRDGTAAKSIARIIWFSMNPSLKMSSEAKWQKGMTAKLSGGVWRVRQKPLGSAFLGGGLEIDLGATDGKVLRVILTQ